MHSSIIYFINFEEHKPLEEKCTYKYISEIREVRGIVIRLQKQKNKTFKLSFNSGSGYCHFNTQSQRRAFIFKGAKRVD